jgi:hypothetical protein
MTEQEWWTCEDSDEMLRQARFRSYRRKSRLFAVACCRCIWSLLVDDRSRKAVEVAERHADGAATGEELRIAAEAAHEAHQELFRVLGKLGSSLEWAAAYAANANPFHGAKCVTWMAPTSRSYAVMTLRPNDFDFDKIELFPCTVTKRSGFLSLALSKWQVTRIQERVATGAEKPTQAALIRCIFGNPFRPRPANEAAWLAWNAGTIPAMAQRIYDERAFDRLPILADALEDAGCTNEDILNHCRQPGVHARGCWVLDLLLGKA